MSNIITLYHGSDKIIEKPEFAKGTIRKDYGQGFYCTQDIELAKEWACSDIRNSAIVNEYTLDMEHLKCLCLYDKNYTILNHIALLMKYRHFTVNFAEEKQYILDNFLIDIMPYDIIQGYRADDRYFKFIKDYFYIFNARTLEVLIKAIKNDKSWEQIVIKSQKAFDLLNFVGFQELNAKEVLEYNEQKNKKDIEGENTYNDFTWHFKKNRELIFYSFLSDITREEWNSNHEYYEYINEHMYEKEDLDYKITEKLVTDNYTIKNLKQFFENNPEDIYQYNQCIKNNEDDKDNKDEYLNYSITQRENFLYYIKCAQRIRNIKDKDVFTFENIQDLYNLQEKIKEIETTFDIDFEKLDMSSFEERIWEYYKINFISYFRKFFDREIQPD